MMKNKLFGLASILGGLLSTSVVEQPVGDSPNVKKKLRKVLRPKLSEKELAIRNEEIKISKGCQRFFYGENYVIALNQKNADRKARNAGWIQ